MPSKPPSALDQALRDKLRQREARAELISSAMFVGSCIFTFGVIAVLGEARLLHSFHILRVIMLAVLGLTGVLAFFAYRGWWHPAISYFNTSMQITLLTAFLSITARENGPMFSLSTALPMLYCLSISITAFRLSTWLSIFAGALAGVELIIAYALFLRPIIPAEILVAAPTLGWPAVIVRVMVLLSIGIACAIAARSLRTQFRQSAKDQGRIQLLERTFGRMVSPEVARQILEDENWMRPARRDAVVMFADLQGFTKFSEHRSPEDVANFLNRCWTVAADVVERHGGTINKYLGDGFLALFGTPLALPEAEKAAVQTAADLQREMAAVLEPEGLNLCIGVHAGPLIVGEIGAESRSEYTVIGSTVNLASRIESLNRPLDTRCLATQPVVDKIQETWHVRDHGGHQVKGVSEAVGVFEPLEKKKPVEPLPPQA